ncbi:Alanyl-tRNA synthetase, partial [hydrothermal vent metagenome]
KKLRFDFSHNKAMSRSELDDIERLANRIVLQNSPVETQLMGVDAAREAGAMALFGEKYGDEVRVVRMGYEPEENASQHSKKPYSMELCGGTHARRTGDIGIIRIVQETSVAAGVRRLEAVSAEGAREYLVAQDDALKSLAGKLKSPPSDAIQRVQALIDERKKLERELEKTRQKIAVGGEGGDNNALETINGFSFSGRVVEGLASKDLRGIVDQTKNQMGSGIAVLIGVTEDGKAGLAVGVTKDLTDKISAVDLVRIGAAALGGKGGGGRDDMAQAGGPDGAKAKDALEEIRNKIASS